ncbi:protein kilB [Streptomyces sp. NPDC051555]|uniref:protein kilB n=1 Tax=Streptomyces sp. NPDC051555 TaxID=3365657 RepID=UPI00378EC940
MWQTVIAVLGTLAGSLVTALLQRRASRLQAEIARQDKAAADRLTAVTAFASVLADHRRAMWVREHLRLNGAPGQQIADARAASHVTRSALTAPHLAVSLFLPTLQCPALVAVEATYALRNASHLDQLTARRTEALSAMDAFTGAARTALSV